jgi:hypothetical protein
VESFAPTGQRRRDQSVSDMGESYLGKRATRKEDSRDQLKNAAFVSKTGQTVQETHPKISQEEESKGFRSQRHKSESSNVSRAQIEARASQLRNESKLEVS